MRAGAEWGGREAVRVFDTRKADEADATRLRDSRAKVGVATAALLATAPSSRHGSGFRTV